MRCKSQLTFVIATTQLMSLLGYTERNIKDFGRPWILRTFTFPVTYRWRIK